MADKNGPEIKRKLYRRGSSFETTIPMPILFQLDTSKKHDVVFKLDKKLDKWFIEFEEEKSDKSGKK
ncbi:MAG: hypothetical protein NT001_05050 [Candidatus Woesearchaeota archaeon]|nr:hypothetical protein [Candidatus Woesearchaeota archaeon]